MVTKTSTIRKPFPNHRENRRRSRCEISCRHREETLLYSIVNQERQKRTYQPWDLPHEFNRWPGINSVLTPRPDTK